MVIVCFGDGVVVDVVVVVDVEVVWANDVGVSTVRRGTLSARIADVRMMKHSRMWCGCWDVFEECVQVGFFLAFCNEILVKLKL